MAEILAGLALLVSLLALALALSHRAPRRDRPLADLSDLRRRLQELEEDRRESERRLRELEQGREALVAALDEATQARAALAARLQALEAQAGGSVGPDVLARRLAARSGHVSFDDLRARLREAHAEEDQPAPSGSADAP